MATVGIQAPRTGRVTNATIAGRGRALLARGHGTLVTVGTITLLEIVDRLVGPSRVAPPVYFLAVVYASFSGGLWMGLLSALIASVHGLYFLSVPGQPFTYAQDDLVRLVLFIMIAPLVALLVGLLKVRADRGMREEQGPVALYRTLVQGVMDYGIYMLDSKGYVVSWNTGAAAIEGYNVDEIIGKHFSVFFTPEDVTRGKPEHMLEMAAAEGRHEDEGWRVRRDGSWFWADVVLTPLWDEEGRLQGFGKVIRDLTERRALEDALRRSAVSRAMVARILRDLQTEGKLSRGAMFRAGRELAQHQTFATLRQYVESFTNAGLGTLEILEASEGRGRWTFSGDRLVEVTAGSQEPTCDYTRGFLSGSVARLSPTPDMAAAEIECQSMGDPRCVFIIQAADAMAHND